MLKSLCYQDLFSVIGTIVLQFLILYDSWIVLLVSVLHEGSNLRLITYSFFLFSLFLWNSLISEIAVDKKRCVEQEVMFERGVEMFIFINEARN